MLKKLHKLLAYPFSTQSEATRTGGGKPKIPPPNSAAHLPSTAKPWFKELLDVYYETPIEFEHLKGITAAQWAKESGWGGSALAREHNNYAGAKWRAGLEPYGRPVTYSAWDGRDTYFHFNDEASFIAAYWKRFDLLPAYKGWRNHTRTPEEFITFIGPKWLGMTPADNARYIKDVLRIYNERTKAIFE